jgi:hypothetical protein
VREYDEEFLESLRVSREQDGELEPIKKAPDGYILDGRKRDATGVWKSVKVIPVQDDVQKVKLRIGYMLKQGTSEEEWTDVLTEACQAVEKELGLPPEKVGAYVAKHVSPHKSSYTRALIPDAYKDKKFDPNAGFRSPEPPMPEVVKASGFEFVHDTSPPHKQLVACELCPSCINQGLRGVVVGGRLVAQADG